MLRRPSSQVLAAFSSPSGIVRAILATKTLTYVFISSSTTFLYSAKLQLYLYNLWARRVSEKLGHLGLVPRTSPCVTWCQSGRVPFFLCHLSQLQSNRCHIKPTSLRGHNSIQNFGLWLISRPAHTRPCLGGVKHRLPRWSSPPGS